MDILVEYLKNQLSPKGTAPVVGLGFKGMASGTAFFDKTFVDAALDELGRRLQSHAVDPITALERLAIDLLLDSAYVRDPKDLDAALKSFGQWKLENDK